MFHALIRKLRPSLRRWARQPFATAGILSLVMLIAAAGPWACIVHCTAPAGAHHAQHHATRHVLAHGDHHPAAHHTADDMGSHAAVSTIQGHVETGVLTHAGGTPKTDGSGTDHALQCPPGPTLTALTFAIMLPGPPLFQMVVLRLRRVIPLPSYTSVDSHPPGPPPRASNSVAI